MSAIGAGVVYVELVIVPSRYRSLSPKQVRTLAQSISEIGLLNPISVRSVGDQHMLIAGRHRLEAVKSLGWTTIPAVEMDLSEVDSKLAEIDENLIRNDLTALERAEHLAERKRLYLVKHPETARGGERGNQHTGGKPRQSETVSFSQDAADRIGVTPRTVQQDVQIAESIPEGVRDAIRDTPLADNKTELLRIARMTEDEQRRAAAGGSPKRRTVQPKRQAARPVDDLPDDDDGPIKPPRVTIDATVDGFVKAAVGYLGPAEWRELAARLLQEADE